MGVPQSPSLGRFVRKLLLGMLYLLEKEFPINLLVNIGITQITAIVNIHAVSRPKISLFTLGLYFNQSLFLTSSLQSALCDSTRPLKK